ncbi:hypothetical protein I215_00510 [Galbibacter marinus]|uniref:Uncharacterized protein n=1 Tax=Galbibacter marinus TaxID=555500 RepID=K2PVD3_9FLAO|nr:hypothetical protein [Galbibacter marinus]EKF56650.1 hypothetical protein I215_00510 [Galbibacter marinus]
MKTFVVILVLIAVSMIGVNITMLDFDNPLEGDSLVAVIGIGAALAAVLLLAIFWQSRRIQELIKDKSNV